MLRILILCSLLLTLPSIAAETQSKSRFAAVDVSRVNESFSLVKEANNSVQEGEEKLKRLFATAETEIKELESKGNAEELEKKKTEIQDIIDDEIEKLQDQKEFYIGEINRSVNQMLETLAKESNYSLVFERSFVINDDITDITDLLVSRLEAARLSSTKKETTTK